MIRGSRFKNQVTILTILILLQACSGLQDERGFLKAGGISGNSISGNATSGNATNTSTVQTNELRDALVQALRDGEYIEINFNRAGHVNDIGWLDEGDPMGHLQAGRKYVLTYK